MNKEAIAKLTKARAALILDNPFFGSLALRLKLVEATNMVVNGGYKMSTMGVDGKHIYYHPDFVNRLSLAHVKFVVAHEVMHCVWSHMSRRQHRDPRKWNVAGDYVINDMLKNLKVKVNGREEQAFDMPPEGLWSAQFSGPDWTADKVYNQLPDPPKGPKGGDKGDGTGGAFDHVIDGDENGPPQDAADRAQMEREWKVATIQAANAAKMAGKLPAELQRFLDDLYKPQVNWIERLRNFISETTRNDYNWLRPNKRFSDVYMPSLHDESVGEIAIVIDDSGSIGAQTLAVFGAEIRAIMQDVRPSKTHLLYCDAEVSAHYELDPDDTPEFKCHGGGGTNFDPPFQMLAEKNILPKCLIYLTDLCGPHGPEADYPVLWVCITDAVAPWGETLHIDDFDKLEAKQ
jgi:predicted metal-dependent peptidase